MIRPFSQRVFVVLWFICILGVIAAMIAGLTQIGERGWLQRILIIVPTVAGILGIPVLLLQYLVLGFFNPFRLFQAR